jgi:hypothetical protein
VIKRICECHLLVYLISKQERAFIYLLTKYAALTAKMRNYGQAVVVEEGIIAKLILISKVQLYLL